tara:strand:- start:1184 stop:2044 length:861 start_codon:yes stop_codon:yes gene_type:complete
VSEHKAPAAEHKAPAAVRWTAYIGIAVLFAIACGFLSNWQFTRNAERSQQLALVEANYDAEPAALDDLVPETGDLPVDNEWHPVALQGTYLVDDTVLVRNRPHGGTAAFEVLVPFQTTDGRILLINRGWVPPAEDSDPSAVPAPPAGTIDVIARLRPGESLPRSGRTEAPEGQVPTIHLPLIAEALGVDPAFITSAYGVMVSETPAAASVPNQLESPSEDPGPYLSYAIQWILFAVMGFFFIGYVIRTEVRHRREETDDTPRPPRGQRRRDRDMAEEDEILDRLPQ